jgi:anaerobic magnesium-protoporphyrin IX monomethyl ester cyclase
MQKILFLVPMHITMDSFVNPSNNTRSYRKPDGKNYNSLRTDLPLGPMSMSAYIKKFVDVDVRLIDFNVELSHAEGFPFQNFYDYCYDFLSSMNFKPDIIGVSSLFSPSFDNFIDCGRAAKDIWPDSLVLGGGNIPTNDYQYIYQDLKCTYFDALCYGEGEKPFRDLLLSNDKKDFLDKSKNWITYEKTKKKGEYFLFNPEHNFIWDLDEIPFFDYDLCDIVRHSIDPVTRAFHNVEDHFGFHIMTSRGCPFKCTFCASHKTHGRDMRYYSLERIREDFTRLKEGYGASTLVFQDDHFMADKQRVYKILEILGELKLGSLYQNGLTLYALDRPMLEAFYAAGVRHLVLPVESGSEKVLRKQMRKPLKLHISERVANDCRDLGIYTNTNILIGMPGETKEDIEDARRNLKKIKTNWFNIACASPLVGSEMYDFAKENDYIEDETRGADYHFAVIKTKDFTPEYIQDIQYIMNLELNFVENNDMKVGDYKTAIIGFKNVMEVRPDHAFAHYFAGKCYKEIKDYDNYEDCRKKYEISSKTPFWHNYIGYFGIESF